MQILESLKHHEHNADICALHAGLVPFKGWFLLLATEKLFLGKNT